MIIRLSNFKFITPDKPEECRLDGRDIVRLTLSTPLPEPAGRRVVDSAAEPFDALVAVRALVVGPARAQLVLRRASARVWAGKRRRNGVRK
jgi:hypothetical protein